MKNSKEYKFKFSIISAIYKVEDYVEETIESIVGQSIGFKENVQLILVDDGSPDNSGVICDKWQAKYPENIIVIHKENGGVSSARNEGLKYAEGKYYNFIDSDDLFSKNSLKDVWNFFEKHEDEIDVVCVPLIYFEARTGDHPLNFKFKNGSRIIDLEQEPEATLFHSASSFFHSRVKDKFLFDTSLAIAEDAKYISQVILEKLKYGVVSTAKYLYRQRLAGNSAINTANTKESWYFPVLEKFYQEIMDYSKAKSGRVPAYIEYSILNDIRWKLNQPFEKNIYKDDIELFSKYKELLFNIYRSINPETLLINPNYTATEKYFILKNIMGLDVKKFISRDDNERFYYDKTTLFYLSNCIVRYHFIEFNKDKIKITFSIDLVPEIENYKVKIKINGLFYNVTKLDKVDEVKKLDEVLYKKVYYCYEFSTDKLPVYFSIFMYDQKNKKFIQMGRPAFEKYFPLNNIENSYFVYDNILLKKISKYGFVIKKINRLKKLFYEFKYNLSLLKMKNKNAKPFKIVLMRWYYKFYKFFHKKKVWLISDRASKAGDNGEAFFLHLKENKIKNVKYKFAIAKGDDYNRLKQFGDVVELKSKKFYKQYLLADDIISSQLEESINIFPLTFKEPFVKDITYFKNIIFLQHGVTNNDISNWLNKYSKKLDGLICTSQNEVELFKNINCYYSDEVLWLTGFARFDRLNDSQQKVISITPTWRLYLTNGTNPETRNPYIVSNFSETKYFNFYNNLINDERLISVAKENGYKIQFAVHPMLIESKNLFTPNEYVTMLDETISYNKLFSESSLLVTDYSSTIYDFIYMNKPVIYTQFDREEMNNPNAHTYNVNYNDYENEGYGEVCYDYESTVETLIGYIKTDCKLKDKYRERIKNTYKYQDKNNCKRIYDRILELDKK